MQQKAVAFIGARGGVGKTTLASLTALLGAHFGMRVALLDLDVQFGDIDFTFNQQTKRTLLDLCMEASLDRAKLPRYAQQLSESLHLYISGGSPEHADFILPHVATLVHAIKTQYDLLVIDTGSFWTSLQVDVAEACDLTALVFDARATTLRATLRARALLNKVGIPNAKVTYCMNHTRENREVESLDASMVLGAGEITEISYAGSVISELMSIGQASALLDESGATAHPLEEMLRKKGLLDNPVHARGETLPNSPAPLRGKHSRGVVYDDPF